MSLCDFENESVIILFPGTSWITFAVTGSPSMGEERHLHNNHRVVDFPSLFDLVRLSNTQENGIFWFLEVLLAPSLWYKPTAVTSFFRTRRVNRQRKTQSILRSVFGRRSLEDSQSGGPCSRRIRKDLLLGFVPMPAAEPCSAYRLPCLPRILTQAWHLQHILVLLVS